MWKTVETKTRKIRVVKAKEQRSKGRIKEAKEKEKVEERKDNGN